MLISVGIAIAIIVSIYILIDISWRLWTRKLSHVTCPFQVPWLGSAPYLEQTSNELFHQLNRYMKECNNIMLIWVGWRPVVFCSRKEIVEDLLQSTELLKKSYHYDFFQDWLGNGLLVSEGKKWRTRRKAITTSFHFSILNSFLEIFETHADVLVKEIKQYADNESVVDIQKITSHATLDVMCDAAMGVHLNAQTSESEYLKCINFVNKQLMHRMFSPWLWPTFIYLLTTNGREYFKKVKILQQFTTDVINERIKERNEKSEKPFEKKKKQAFMDMLLDLYDQGEIDIDGIREEVDTFMFEGHDTTSSGLSWILYELGNHQEVQRKLQQEIDATIDMPGTVMDKIHSVKYLEQVIKESFRFHPPVGLFGRKIHQDEILGGMKVPKGTTITVNVYGLHRSEEYWNNPEDFLPDRFADDAKRHPFVFIPFSAGSRNCIGQKFAMMELKVMIYNIMSKFTITSLDKEDELRLTADIIHKSIDGLRLKFIHR